MIYMLMWSGAVSAQASHFNCETQPRFEAVTQPSVVACSSKAGKIVVSTSAGPSPYSIYEGSLRTVKGCRHIQIGQHQFYIFKYTALVEEGDGRLNLLYEIAQLKEGKWTPVRSEIVDSIPVTPDLKKVSFRNTLDVRWGKNMESQLPLLHLCVGGRGEDPFGFLAQFNSRRQWFEDL